MLPHADVPFLPPGSFLSCDCGLRPSARGQYLGERADLLRVRDAARPAAHALAEPVLHHLVDSRGFGKRTLMAVRPGRSDHHRPRSLKIVTAPAWMAMARDRRDVRASLELILSLERFRTAATPRFFT